MADETLADVLAQDGPETEPQDPAEVSTPAEPTKAGDEPDPQATTNDGTEETEDKPKRLGGWQRKIAKLTEQNDMLMEMLQRKAETTPEAAKPSTKPPRPDAMTFQGTTQEFSVALDKYEDDLVRWHDEQSQQKEQQREYSELVGSFNQRVTELPEFDQMRGAASGMSDRLVNFMQVQLAKLKNGPDVLREAVMDAETKDELIHLDKLGDGAAIQAQLHAIATALRIANRKSGTQKPASVSSAPDPVKPVKKAAPGSNRPEDTEDFKEYVRRRDAQIKARQ